MSTYFLVLRVIPTPLNEHRNEVEGALASCWVCTEDLISATNMAAFKVTQLHWQVVGIEDPPRVVTENDCGQNEGDLERYATAQGQGISITFEAWSKDGTTYRGPIGSKKSKDFDLGDYLSQMAELKRRGRCLHFDAGTRCTEPIDAHSIQKSGVLSLIAQSGHVYIPSRNLNDTRRSFGGVTFAKQGINAVSTFRGFCGKHDNELFEPIDNHALEPTPQQITLYAYRSLCREVFVKENAVTLFRSLTRLSKRNPANAAIFNSVLKGANIALEHLLRQKSKHEALLKSNSFDSMKSVLFHSHQKPFIVFSGLLFPDYDFLGNPLQDLSDHRLERHLVAFSFAPMSDGWGFLVAWHEDNSETCIPLVKSLATQISDGGNLGDFLFRFVVSSSENLAMSPTWWESLSESQRADIEQAASYGIKIFSPLRNDYLTYGLQSSEWEFDRVIENF
jgi:hypothetical protein